jgi:hypothetical protein
MMRDASGDAIRTGIMHPELQRFAGDVAETLRQPCT